jgi:hypothetical protein
MSDSASISSSAQYFQSKGGVVTISAGNNSTFDASADNPYVLTVSATDSTDAMASWSNYGNNIDLAAPGVSIYTTTRGGGYGYWNGTSFSAPIVAGVAALILSVNPSLSGVDARSILEQSADDLGAAGWDSKYGYGRVNAARAVSKALSNGGPDTIPPTVSFASPANGATVSGTVNVQINASDNVAVQSVTFSVDGVGQGTAAVAPYNFSWDTTAVTNGSHTLTAQATDTSGNTSSTQISVTVNNSAPDTTPPTCSITSPTGGKVGSSLTVTATASDNVGVTKVELWVDGKLSQTLTTPPWTFTLNTRRWAPGNHTLQCRAYDAAGNVGLSQVVTVTK